MRLVATAAFAVVFTACLQGGARGPVDPDRGPEGVIGAESYSVDRIEGESGVVYLYDAASAAGARGDHQEQCNLYSQARDAEPDNAQAYIGLGTCSMGLKQYTEARSYYEEATRLDPTSSNAEMGLGSAWSLSGDENKAVEHYERAVQLDPNNADAHFGAAGSWSTLRASAKSRRHALRFIELAPDSQLVPNARRLAMTPF